MANLPKPKSARRREEKTESKASKENHQAPNDKMIHVSECANDKCPLQHVWKN